MMAESGCGRKGHREPNGDGSAFPRSAPVFRRAARCYPYRMPPSASTTVAIVSDTHGGLDSRVAEIVAGCDHAVHAGDIGNSSVLEALRPRSGRVLAVRGNNDVPRKWPVQDLPVLAQLPTQAALDLPGGRLAVVHGHRCGGLALRHQRLRKAFAEVRVVVYGHSHRLACDQEALPWVLNPGAAGYSRTFGGPSCLLLRASEGEWSVEIRRFEPVRRR